MGGDVRTVSGVPVAANFASATGTPIVINDLTGDAYWLNVNTVTPMRFFGAGSVTSVNASGGTTGLSFTGGPITTSGTLTLTGTLAVANGGTGITAFGTGVATALGVNVGSAGAFVTFNGALGTPSSGTATNLTGTAAGLTAGTASAVAVGGITGLGTGVATALAVNVGSAGAFVTFNGALGTPSSGTVTNLTGTASININGTVGATTPTTGAFTTLTSTGATVLGGSGGVISAGAQTVYGANANGILYGRHTSTTAGKYFSFGPDGGNNYVVFNQGGVGVYVTDGGTSWTATSDERLKDIIEPISGALAKVSVLRSVIGKYKDDDAGKRRSFLIAQDVQKVLPEAVTEREGLLGLNYTEVIPLLVAAINELAAKVENKKIKEATG